MQADVGVAMGRGTDIAIELSDIILVRDRLEPVLVARDLSIRSYRKTKRNIALAFLFNGIGVPAAATGLVYPVWAMAAMAFSVTAIFINSIGTRPALLIDALQSVGRSAAGETRTMPSRLDTTGGPTPLGVARQQASPSAPARCAVMWLRHRARRAQGTRA